MNYKTLISVAELQAVRAAGTPLVLLDCSFDLTDTGAGARAYTAGHLPGAVYAHLDADLSGAKTGRNGRHPLPLREALAAAAGRWGIAPGVQVVTYDAQGAPYASRAWWLLRWLGHDAVAVLDGGLAAWQAAGGALSTAAPANLPCAPYPPVDPAMPTIDADGLLAQRGGVQILDARNAERFRGEVEPLDAVAGHIPGATLRFFKDNLDPDGLFKPAAQLRAEFNALGVTSRPVVQQCGSGVTACHNLLAMAHAGLGLSTLYPGSWSEWCSDPQRPVARGGPWSTLGRSAAAHSRQGLRAHYAPQATRPADTTWSTYVQAHPLPHRRFRDHCQGRADGNRHGQDDGRRTQRTGGEGALPLQRHL
jgi:thiosulfate/3-mercaptopyruvate sulfurtransferase